MTDTGLHIENQFLDRNFASSNRSKTFWQEIFLGEAKKLGAYVMKQNKEQDLWVTVVNSYQIQAQPFGAAYQNVFRLKFPAPKYVIYIIDVPETRQSVIKWQTNSILFDLVSPK